ncbi:MAG: DHFR protein [Caudoviricetes sp.]|nr:MAG: DHFR protein [Caudoviricetes sp.]
MTISMIVATDINGCIGKNNTLPFNSKKDMKHFVNMTKGKDVIMGRKTWDSLPKKPLPNRKNIIITRANLKYFDTSNENVIYVNSLDEALDISKDPFIIGGEQIYSQCEKYADIIYMTIFPTISIEGGDAFFKLSQKWYISDQRTEYENDLLIEFKELKKRNV